MQRLVGQTRALSQHPTDNSIVTDNRASISGAVEQVKFGPATSLGVINGINLLVALLCKHSKLIVDAFEFANRFVVPTASLTLDDFKGSRVTRLISTLVFFARLLAERRAGILQMLTEQNNNQKKKSEKSHKKVRNFSKNI